MKKGTKKSTHHKKADPVKVPRMADESKPLKEAESPKAEHVGGPAPDCKRSDCLHSDSKHYGSANRWCNMSGCTCQAYL